MGNKGFIGRFDKLKTELESEFEDTDIFLAFGAKELEEKIIETKNYKKTVVASLLLFSSSKELIFSHSVRDNLLFAPAIFEKSINFKKVLDEIYEKISEKNAINLFVFHGSNLKNIDFSFFQKELESLDGNSFLCTIKGELSFFRIQKELESRFAENKKIQIIPMFLASSNHYNNEIMEIKNRLNRFDVFIATALYSNKEFNLLELKSVRTVIKNGIAMAVF